MLKSTTACHLASVQRHQENAESTRVFTYADMQKVSWQHCGTRGTQYALGGDESKATPPLHHSTSHQNPTTSISMDIAPHHLHLHNQSLHHSSATLRRTSCSARQLAPQHTTPTPDTHTGFRPPIPTRHLHTIIPYCQIFPILVFSPFRHHELHFWGLFSAVTQWRGAPVVASEAMVLGLDERTMT
jgi:hypothetical protein